MIPSGPIQLLQFAGKADEKSKSPGLAVGSHLCCKLRSVYRRPLGIAALTPALLSDHMTLQYDFYFDISDKLVPDHQSYSKTIYECGYRLNGFATFFPEN